MSYLVSLTLEGRPAVVVGAGQVARRKVEGLLQAEAAVTVVAPGICAEIQALADAGRVALRREPYGKECLAGVSLVIAATNHAAVNAQVARDARELGILVNVVDRPALCTFTLPATLRRGDLTVAVATGGRCPALASAVREDLEAQFGDEYGEVVALLGRLREQLMAAGWEGFRVRQALISLYRAGLPELIAAGDQAGVRKLVAAFTGLQP
ncbi:MAG: bifunctional precorrin-2 dehydrogenase/sirohydrochlorin ferrochelatase [Acidobacteria bacterium]|nr:bifunctional precorrin-2 dehydrogenase/sirohydrochlorin ferrochelatase [Acidobacteriota bacterium]